MSTEREKNKTKLGTRKKRPVQGHRHFDRLLFLLDGHEHVSSWPSWWYEPLGLDHSDGLPNLTFVDNSDRRESDHSLVSAPLRTRPLILGSTSCWFLVELFLPIHLNMALDWEMLSLSLLLSSPTVAMHS